MIINNDLENHKRVKTNEIMLWRLDDRNAIIKESEINEYECSKVI